MKRLILIGCLILAALEITAQTRRVQRWEVEPFVGVDMPLGSYHNGALTVSGNLGIEVRYNVEDSPWDCGAFLRLDCAQRNYSHILPNTTFTQNNRTMSVGVSGGYNFRQGERVNPFASLGIGIGFNDVVGDKVYDSSGTSVILLPKVGVEFFRWVRLNAFCLITRKGYNAFGFSLGLTIGGRPKKLSIE